MDIMISFATTVKAIVDTHWQDNERPILLSFLTKPLKEKLGDESYALITKGKSLKEVVKESSEKYGYKLIEHPTQKAKIGVIPIGKTYNFENNDGEKQRKFSRNEKTFDDQEIVLSFLKLLQKLPPQELEKVIIPASVITLLLNDK